MRITREFLFKSARTHAAQKAYSDQSIICIYLVGSVLREEPLLNGTTDIDLICVHEGEPQKEREVIRLNDEIHLDLAHYPMKLFKQPRSLRRNAWIGGHMIEDPKLLYESKHWFEFTQASVASKFYSPETILERLRPMEEGARAAWMEMSQVNEIDLPVLSKYVKNVETIGNVLACFSGPPLTTRRFWMDYPDRLQKIQAPAWANYLSNLFMTAAEPGGSNWETWTSNWLETLNTVSRQQDATDPFKPCRLNYYLAAVDVMKQSLSRGALWILLRTWLQAGAQLRSNSCLYKPLGEFLAALGFTPSEFEKKLGAMDQMLDGLEEFIDQYARQNGVVST